MSNDQTFIIVGASLAGAKAAETLREEGFDGRIVLLGAEPDRPYERPPLSKEYLRGEAGREKVYVHGEGFYGEHDVELRTSTTVQRVEPGSREVVLEGGERVRTSDGRALDCDLVVVGVGVAPRVRLAADTGIAVEDGIVVDDRLRTSVDGVFAAGDVANAEHPLFGRLRVEHWANALNQGPAAARNMLGRDTAYDRIPYFFSDQYDVAMEYSGHAVDWDEVVFRGDPASRELIAFWLRDGRVLAGMNVNVWDVTEPIQALIRGRAPVDRARLADPDTPLEDLTERSTT